MTPEEQKAALLAKMNAARGLPPTLAVPPDAAQALAANQSGAIPLGPGATPITDELARLNPKTAPTNAPIAPAENLLPNGDPELLRRIEQTRAMLGRQEEKPSPLGIQTPSFSMKSYTGPAMLGTVKSAVGQMGELKLPDPAPYKDQLDRAEKSRRQGLEILRDSQQTLANTRAQINEDAQRKMKAEQSRYLEARGRAEGAVAEKKAVEQQIIDDIAGTKIKRKNPYTDSGPGKGVALVLLGAISGAAAGFRGKESQVIDIINSNIERDYQAQKDALEGKQQKLAVARQSRIDALSGVKDEDERHHIYVQASLRDAQLRLAQAADLASSDDARAKYFEGIGLLEQQLAANGMSMDTQRFNSEMSRIEAIIKGASTQVHTQEQTGVKPTKDLQRMELEMKQRVIPGREYRKEGSPGPTQQDYETAVALDADLKAFNRLAANAAALYREVGGGSVAPDRWAGDKRRRLMSLANEMVLIRKKAENMGAALTENEQRLLNIDDPNKLALEWLASLSEGVRSFGEKAEDTINNRGFYLTKPAIEPDI
jgi:hypothetical protein